MACANEQCRVWRGQRSLGRWQSIALGKSLDSTGESSQELAGSRDTTLPPLSFAPARYSVVAERFQEFANEIAGLRLEEDGMAGGKTSGAFMTIFGYPLVGREESTYRPAHADRYRDPISGCGAGALE